ncbi:hypothetical protein [Thermoanaerobacter uzonensis]|uniref:hypothetical protein n=1 Tax=Thermoanaerobacter uzonensis TaxID=447593 RepID=UPI00190ED2B9|nr:hypothetical protein [Thermoanaerobacter uzonensis]
MKEVECYCSSNSPGCPDKKYGNRSFNNIFDDGFEIGMFLLFANFMFEWMELK